MPPGVGAAVAGTCSGYLWGRAEPADPAPRTPRSDGKLMLLTHEAAITSESCHAGEVIEQALTRHGIPEIVNTDQGSQFTADEFTDAVLDRGCKRPMDGRGAWRDNAFLERL